MKFQAALVLILCFSTHFGCGIVCAEDRPNIVVILADDLGYGDLGFTGSQEIPTPHIDQLAASGVRCQHGYVNHPYCAPTRAALMTGRYQQRFGFEVNPPFAPQNQYAGLPPTETTIATRLKEAGYATGMVGKWHLGSHSVHNPRNRGFDFFCGFTGGGHDYFKVDMTKPAYEGYLQPLERNGKPLDINGYLTHQLTDEAVGFVECNKDKPFFLYVAYNAPHAPLHAPKETIERFAHLDNPLRAAYAAMVVEMDNGVGKLIESLEQNGMRDNTLIFFLSDNGGPTSWDPDQPFASNAPFRGHKGDLYDGGVHVPFVASWPAKLPTGTRFEPPVIALDISQTAVALAGGDETGMEGANLIPHLTGENSDPPHEAIYFRRRNGIAWAILTSNLTKLVKTDWNGKPELFMLAEDVAEANDRIAEHKKLRDELKAKWKLWNVSNEAFSFSDYSLYHEQADEFYRTMKPK